MTTQPHVQSVVPASSFGWLDHSDEDSQRVRELLKALDEKGTLDAIGIGTVRDAISDTLFPGTSTLHTRARYLLFIPWIYRGMERERIPAARARMEGRQREIRLARALVKGSPGAEGIIGARAGTRLVQLPRAMYWSALRRFEIARQRRTLAQYLDRFDSYHPRRREVEETDLFPVTDFWDQTMPEAPQDLLDEASFDLDREEAGYLFERIVTATDGTLLATLLRSGALLRSSPYAWATPDHAELPAHLREQLAHAEVFSLLIHGAHLRYNALLAGALRADGRETAAIDDAVEFGTDAWLSDLDTSRPLLDRWDRDDFWRLVLTTNPRIPHPTRVFVNEWTTRVLGDPAEALTAQATADLIVNRERRLKGALAKLTSARAREGATEGVALGRLNFRWFNVARMADDITAARAA